MTPCEHERKIAARRVLPCARASCPGNEGYGLSYRMPLSHRDMEAGEYWADKATSSVCGMPVADFDSDGYAWTRRAK